MPHESGGVDRGRPPGRQPAQDVDAADDLGHERSIERRAGGRADEIDLEETRQIDLDGEGLQPVRDAAVPCRFRSEPIAVERFEQRCHLRQLPRHGFTLGSAPEQVDQMGERLAAGDWALDVRHQDLTVDQLADERVSLVRGDLLVDERRGERCARGPFTRAFDRRRNRRAVVDGDEVLRSVACPASSSRPTASDRPSR